LHCSTTVNVTVLKVPRIEPGHDALRPRRLHALALPSHCRSPQSPIQLTASERSDQTARALHPRESSRMSRQGSSQCLVTRPAEPVSTPAPPSLTDDGQVAKRSGGRSSAASAVPPRISRDPRCPIPDPCAPGVNRGLRDRDRDPSRPAVTYAPP